MFVHALQAAAACLVATKDSLVADRSAVSELMNVAWAQHEIVADHVAAAFDFCERQINRS